MKQESSVEREDIKEPFSEMNIKAEKFDVILSNLKKIRSSLEERVAKEKSDKLEARVADEKLQASLLAELEKIRQEKSAAEQKAALFEDMYNRGKQKELYNLQAALCVATEGQMKNKEEELNSIIMELRKNYASLQEKFTKEEADKLAAANSLVRMVKYLIKKTKELEEQRSLQNGQIRILQKQLVTAEEKLQLYEGKNVRGH
ncbi:kinesin-like protein KIN-14D isoform X1 [Alnus glutinosa]|uniref:kinesin-like protein KIN-14D isoform X1 n=1 Tax=Alnus glutinosa TaxID=3517 RepID=UPI002D76DC67|nr:kinesin-like protein KIN-14D isoform X1 [Alnus glutinosa]